MQEIDETLTLEGVIPKFELLLMCSVSERFALLFALGLERKVVRRFDMEGRPDVLGDYTLRNIEQLLGANSPQLQSFYANIMAMTLPEGIPDIRGTE